MNGRPVLKFKLISPLAKIPSYAHDTDAGFDIYSIEQVSLLPRDRVVVKTGISSEIPDGWYIQFFSKSGLAAKSGVSVLGGVIDSGYRGEWGIILINVGNEKVVIGEGDKICQGVFLPIMRPEIEQVAEVGESERGEGNFGSTGKQ